MKKSELLHALRNVPMDREIGCSHDTADLFAEDSTGRPRFVVSFKEKTNKIMHNKGRMPWEKWTC